VSRLPGAATSTSSTSQPVFGIVSRNMVISEIPPAPAILESRKHVCVSRDEGQEAAARGSFELSPSHQAYHDSKNLQKISLVSVAHYLPTRDPASPHHPSLRVCQHEQGISRTCGGRSRNRL
jgi:hypothetical protein